MMDKRDEMVKNILKDVNEMSEKEIDDVIMNQIRRATDTLAEYWKYVDDSWKHIVDEYPEPVKNVLDELCVVCKEYTSIVSKETMTDVEMMRARDIIRMLKKKYMKNIDGNEIYRHHAVQSMISWVFLTPIPSIILDDDVAMSRSKKEAKKNFADDVFR